MVDISLLVRTSDSLASARLVGLTPPTTRAALDEIVLTTSVALGANLLTLELRAEDGTTARNISISVRRHMLVTCPQVALACKVAADGSNECDSVECRLHGCASALPACSSPHRPLAIAPHQLVVAPH